MTARVWIALAIGTVVGFGIATALHSLLDALVRSATKRSAADCIAISIALENYRKDHGQYPPFDGEVEHLGIYLAPDYLRHVPTLSTATGEKFLVFMKGSTAAVVSPGRYSVVVQRGELTNGAVWERP